MRVSRSLAPFQVKSAGNIYRLFFLVVLILAGLWFLRMVSQGAIRSPFAPTPTPTRSANSFLLEAEARFTAGDLQGSIQAYQEAARLEPQNARILARLARVQTYASALVTTDRERKARLEEALASANKAVELDPENSEAHAVRAFVLDWYANPVLIGERQAQAYLTEAEQEAVRALQLDNQNTLALAYYAEILVDQQKWTQAERYIQQALTRAPNLMDVYRIYAYVLESQGAYKEAIQAYDQAIRLAPNLTFLYLRAGANYRRLGFGAPTPEQAKPLYDEALRYFATAVRINEQIGVRDPLPYLSIAKVYSQMGEYFIAGRNVLKALSFDPSNPDVYGQLGIVYFKSRNYEGSIPALKCAIRGCTAEESCEARGGCAEGETGVAVQGLPLTANTVVYYYTYGSVLAALSRPRQNYCPEALQVLGEVKAAFPNDPDIAGIVAAGEAICNSLGTTSPYPSTMTPMPPLSPTLTPTPMGGR